MHKRAGHNLFFLIIFWLVITGFTQPVFSADTLLDAGFEVPDNLTGWSVSNIILGTKAQDAYAGAQFAEFQPNVAGAILSRTIDLSAYQGAASTFLTFAWQDAGNWETADTFAVEIDSAGTGSWHRIYSHAGNQNTYVVTTIDLDSLSSLSAAYGLRFRFIWDNNGATEGAYLDSVVITGVQAQPPVLTGLSSAANISAVQTTDGTRQVAIAYETADQEKDSVYITAEYRVGVGGWAAIPAAYLAGDTGRVGANNAATDRTITWDVNGHLPGTEGSTYQVRLTADDGSGGANDSTTTAMAAADLVVDTRNPLNLAGLAVIGSTATSCTLSWTSATDGNFDHYEVWLGTDAADVAARGGSAVQWDDGDDAALAAAATGTTVITGLSPVTTYHFKIWAADGYGNDTTVAGDSVTTLATPAPSVTGWDPALNVNAVQYSDAGVRIGYEVSDSDDDTVTVSAQYMVAGAAWQNLTANITGDTGRIASSTTANDTILWDILTAFGAGTDTTVTVRVIATDGSNTDTSSSAAFNIDTRVPQGPTAFQTADSTASSVTLAWTAATETNFDHYEIWYGASLANVNSRSGAAEWDADNQAALATVTTSGAVITGLTPNTGYYFRIWAVDIFGRETGAGPDSITTQDVDPPFAESFEPPADLGDWVISNAVVNTGNPYSGTQAAELEPNAAGAWIYRDFDLAVFNGSADMTLFFAFADIGGLETTDSFYVDVNRNGAGWQRLYSHGGNQDAYQEVTIDLDSAGTITDNYRIRFSFNWDNAGPSEGMLVDSVVVNGSLPTAPTLTGLSAAPNITAGQSTDGTGIVTISFEAGDAQSDSVYMTADYRAGSGEWTAIPATYLSGDTGRIDGNNTATDRSITWDVGSHLTDTEASNYQVRLTADDESGGAFDSTTTAMAAADLIVDTRGPQDLAAFSAVGSTATACSLGWGAATESHFDHYEIWLGTALADVNTRGGGAVEWDQDDDAGLAAVTAGTTVVSGLSPDTKYYFKIWAVDSLGNEASAGPDSISTGSTPAPSVTGWDPSLNVNASQYDSGHVRIGYEVSDSDNDTVTVTAQYLVQGGTWQNLTTDIAGDTGRITTSTTANDTILWDILAAFGTDKDTTVMVRVIAHDGTYADTTASAAFNIDTRAPQGLGSLAHTDSSYNSVSLSWTAVTETNFGHYEIWYGTGLADVNARSGSAAKWNGSSDPDLTERTTTTTTVTALTPNTKYYFRIWAADSFGRESADGTDSCVTQNGTLPFSEDFEIDLSSWTVSNGADVYRSATASYSGTWAVMLDNLTGWLYTSLDLTLYQGASDVQATFAFIDNGNIEADDSLFMEIYDGSWKRAWAHGGNQDAWSVVTVDLDSLGTMTSDFRIRFRLASDHTGDEFLVDSVYVSGSTPSAPTLTGLSAAPNITAAQSTDGTRLVTISYEAADAEADSVYITADYRVNGEGWAAIPAAYLSGDTGRIGANNAATDRAIVWDVGSHLAETEAANYQVRLTADDEQGGPYDSTVTAMAEADLVVDTKNPLSLAALAAAGSTATTCTLAWTAATDPNFGHYEIWLGTALADVNTRSGGAVEWDDTDDADLLTVTTATTAITGLSPVVTYYFKIWAVDTLGNETAAGPESVTTLSTPAPSVSGWDPALNPAASQYGADSVRIGYEVSDTDNDTVSVSLQYLVAGGTWQNLTADIIGDTGQVPPSETTDDTVLWDILTAFGSGTDTTVTVRVIAADGIYADTAVTASFNVDTRAPQGLGSLAHTDSTYNSVSLSWTTVTETNFDHYEIWYGTSLADVNARGGTAAEWNGSADPNMTLKTTSSTTVSGLDPATKYYFRIWAADSFGRESADGTDSCTTQSGTLPFTDDFEASLNNWTLSSGTDVTRTNTAAYSGTWSVLLDNQSSWMYTSLDLGLYEGATDVQVSFAFQDNGQIETADSFWVDIYDGSWKRAFSHGGNQDAWSVVTLDLDSIATLTTDVRIRFTLASDNNGDEFMVDDVSVTGSTPTAPTLTGLSGAAYISAAQLPDGSGQIRIDFETGDAEADSVYMTASYRQGSDAWTDIPMEYLSGDTGRIDGSNTAADRQIIWDAAAHLGPVNGTDYQLRLTANDELGGLYDSTTTTTQNPDLVFDTEPPDADLTLTAVPLDQNRVALVWTPENIDAGDADSVGIWYKTGDYPDSAHDPTATRLTGYTLADYIDTVTGLAEDTRYYFILCVRDTNGNWTDTVSSASDSAWTWPTSSVTVTATDLTPTFTPGDTVAAVRLAFSSITGDPRIPQINIKRTSTATDTDVPRAFIYEDSNQDDIIDNKNAFISTNIVVSGSTSVINLQYTVLSTTSNWLVAFAIAPDASVTNQAGMAINGNDIYGMDWTTVTFGGITTGTYPLPVELAFFYGTAGPRGITLQWRTESEKDNLKWEILRATAGQEGFTLIHEEFKEAGEQTTPFATDYSFTDEDVSTGATYYYILVDVAVDGERTRHGPVKVEATMAAPDPDLVGFTPNPFRDRALIVFGQVLTEVTVYIHTNDGHEVARLTGTNTNLLYWDSRTAGIHARSPGLYYVTAVWTDERGMNRRKTLAVQKRK